MSYLKRVVDDELELKLKTFGGVLIVGPKWCGKTTTAKQKSKSVLQMQDPDKLKSYMSTIDVKPSLLLKGDKPRLIDEWQIAPVLWDAVRTSIDEEQTQGLYILTGSTSVDDKKIMHTGTGRIARMKMYPMSLYETKESNGEISLNSLFDNPKLDMDGTHSDLTIEKLIFAACRGGWPASLNLKDDESKLLISKEYINNICESDVNTIDGISRNPVLTRTLLASYSRNISTFAKKNTIMKDIQANFENITAPTFDAYLNALERLFVIEDVPAWCPAIRSASAIRSSKKLEFVDPSIAVASQGLSPTLLEQDLNTFGFIFECLCIRDLKVYSQHLGGHVSYYHDRYGLEADCVLHLENGKYALIEFKLGSREIEEGSQHLLELKGLIKNANMREPDLLIVLTGGEIAYTRDDGVKIIPIGTLKD